MPYSPFGHRRREVVGGDLLEEEALSRAVDVRLDQLEHLVAR